MDKTQAKLNRIQGQVAGIVKMYQEERDCLEIVQQIVAVRSALSRVGRDILGGEASRCTRGDSQANFDKILKTLFEL